MANAENAFVAEYSKNMGKSPLILAALAKDAVPQLDFSRVETFGSQDGAIDTVLLTATDGEHYLLKQPKTQNAAVAIETEINALRAFTSSLRVRLPFNITNVVGETRDSYGKRAILFSFVYGNPIDLTTINADDSLLESIAKATAAIHNLPLELVENAGLPQYSVQEAIRMRVAELDRAAQTGQVPPALLQRWETAFEDVSLFKFQPCVIHGDLNGDHMLENEAQVSGVLEWSSLKIGDPAEDLRWVVGAHNPDAAYSLIHEYQTYRQQSDQFLRQRAHLYAELEIAGWLLYGHRINDDEIVQDALGLLQDLKSDLEAGALPALSSAAQPAAVASPVTTFTAPMPIIASEPELSPIDETPVADEPIAWEHQNDESDADEQIEAKQDPAASNDLPAFLFDEDDKKKDELF